MKDQIVYSNYNFSGNAVESILTGREKSLPVSSLGIDTFEAEVKCRNPEILKFRKNDPLYHYRGGIRAGVYHVQSIEQVSPDHYAISAVSPLGMLAKMKHYGGIYTGQTALVVIQDICGPVPVLVKTRLENTALYGWLPIVDDARDNLRRVLFALGANLGTDHNGVLRVEPLWSGYASYIPAERVYLDNASVTQDDPVTSVTVLEHRYVPGTERKDLFEGTTYQGQRISFSGPMHTLTAEGFAILESGANYAVVSAGTGKLTGAEYVHSTIEVTRKVSDAQIPNDVRVPEDATLVSLVNSAAVADRLSSYYACRSVINLDMTLRRERPGEVVQIVDPYSRRMVTAAISSIEEDVSSVVKASVSALAGFSPAQFGSAEYYDERVVLTGSGTWTPPEGVSEVTAVLIGAGSGGASGMMGKAPTPGKVSSMSNSQWNTRAQIKETGAGGEGGPAGAGGKGGKVLQVTIDLSGVSSLAYSCGVGGPGGKASRDRNLAEEADKSAPGSAGTDTTFGSYSSASGSSSPAGYYDPITKEIFAADGSAGVAGGKGGGLASEDDKHSQAPGPDVVYEGAAYHGGASHEEIKTADAGFYDEHTVVSAAAYYGAGGGAAAGANGEMASDEPSAKLTNTGWTVGACSAEAIGGAGGRGADAVAPKPQTTPGKGGTGGNGGGGAGGGGASSVESNVSGDPGTSPPWVKSARTEENPSQGARGLGSDGSQGGPGCVILYYSVGVKKRAGAFVTKNKSFLLDRSGRLFIV